MAAENAAGGIDLDRGQHLADRRSHVGEIGRRRFVGRAVVVDLLPSFDAVPHLDLLDGMIEGDAAVGIDCLNPPNAGRNGSQLRCLGGAFDLRLDGGELDDLRPQALRRR